MSGRQRGRRDGELFPAKLTPGPHGLPRELVRENQRQRILMAALDVFADRGFAAATVKDLIRAAHVSRSTFYELFADKEACLVALHDELLTSLWEQVAPVVAGASGWSAQVRAAVTETVRLLADDPRRAAICLVEAPHAGAPQVRASHDRMVERLCSALRTGRAESRRARELPEILEPALVSGALYLLGRSIVHGQGADTDTLSAELPQLLTLPYRT